MPDLKEREPKNESRAVKKTTEKQKTNRVHVSYPETMKDRLEEIKTDTDKGTLSEVFRQALLFYALAWEEHKKGNDFVIRSPNGETERLRMFL